MSTQFQCLKLEQHLVEMFRGLLCQPGKFQLHNHPTYLIEVNKYTEFLVLLREFYLI